jgi:hypothetical protein
MFVVGRNTAFAELSNFAVKSLIIEFLRRQKINFCNQRESLSFMLADYLGVPSR